MYSHPALSSNFSHLHAQDEQLARLGMLAERYFADDPNTCLLKLRQLSEVIAQVAASYVGIFRNPDESQYDLLNRLRDHGILPQEIHELFSEVRHSGNAAIHSLSGDHQTALAILEIVWKIGVWLHCRFRESDFVSSPFSPPQHEIQKIHIKLEALSNTLLKYRLAEHQATQQQRATEDMLQATKEDRAYWEQMVADVVTEKATLRQGLVTRQDVAAKLQLDAAETRLMIDEQLRLAGWAVDSESIGSSVDDLPQ